jgi:ASC-1-like (ASCH) protein
MARTLWIKEQYLQNILAGDKDIEVRVAYSNIARLQPGDVVRLNDRYPATIRRVARYRSFAELLQSEDVARIAPQLDREQVLSALRAIYPPEKEALGVVALQLELSENPDETQG